jgi:hypothetical protein
LLRFTPRIAGCGSTWRTYARGVPNEPIFVNRTMQECARAFAGRRIRAVDDSARVVDVWT